MNLDFLERIDNDINETPMNSYQEKQIRQSMLRQKLRNIRLASLDKKELRLNESLRLSKHSKKICKDNHQIKQKVNRENGRTHKATSKIGL